MECYPYIVFKERNIISKIKFRNEVNSNNQYTSLKFVRTFTRKAGIYGQHTISLKMSNFGLVNCILVINGFTDYPV